MPDFYGNISISAFPLTLFLPIYDCAYYPARYSKYMQNDSIPHEPILAFWREGKLPIIFEPEEDDEEIAVRNGVVHPRVLVKTGAFRSPPI